MICNPQDGHFNSRPHEEVDNYSLMIQPLGQYFNSRPHEEVDLAFAQVFHFWYYFNSRPHEEVDQELHRSRNYLLNFNSRPHEEVDTIGYQWCILDLSFQLTTSRRGRPCEDYKLEIYEEISTHDLTKRSTEILNVMMCQYLFQLTTSRRGRPCPGRSRFLAVEFQLTTSRRGRRRICDIVCRISYFNSRPHEEVDELFVPLPITHSYFNSRPHEEVDNEPKCFIGFNLNISTHDLTKRSTIF